MRNKLTLARVINNFMRSHPKYKVTLLDINECMYVVSNHFAPLVWSNDGEFAHLRRTIMMRDQEIAELKQKLAEKK